MLRVRFDEDQWEELQRLSKESDLSMSEIVRDKMQKKTLQNKKHAQEIIRSSKQISNNVNQIARWVNTHHSGVNRVELLAYLVKIMHQQQEIKAIFEQ